MRFSEGKESDNESETDISHDSNGESLYEPMNEMNYSSSDSSSIRTNSAVHGMQEPMPYKKKSSENEKRVF